jgi:hypothetical protein
MEKQPKQRRRHPGLTRLRDESGRYVRRDIMADPPVTNVPATGIREKRKSTEFTEPPGQTSKDPDPRSVLAAIMSDPAMPPTSRVEAAKALLREARSAPAEKADAKEALRRDQITARALALMGKPH